MTRDRLTYLQALYVVWRAPAESIHQLRFELRRRHVRLVAVSLWPLQFLLVLLCFLLMPLTAFYVVACDAAEIRNEIEARRRADAHYGHLRRKQRRAK